MIEIFTDGSSRQSSNEGGFGVIAFRRRESGESAIIYAYQKQFKDVTNNQMELMAIIHAYEFAIKYFPNENTIIWSDSSYCVNAINEWSHTWIQNGWVNSKKEPIKNLDLMKTLYKYFNTNFSLCQVKWLKGHNNNFGNELADAAATNNKAKFLEILNINHIQIENIDLYKKI